MQCVSVWSYQNINDIQNKILNLQKHAFINYYMLQVLAKYNTFTYKHNIWYYTVVECK